jgi:hypothetical protein
VRRKVSSVRLGRRRALTRRLLRLDAKVRRWFGKSALSPKERRRLRGGGVAAHPLCLADLVRHVRSSSEEDGPIAEILLERADRVLAADGGRYCKRVLNGVEIDGLLAGDEPEGGPE